MSKQLQLQRRYAREDEKARHAAFAYLVNSPEGRKMLWWLLEACGIARTPFALNALQMSFNAGQQNIGLMLQAEIQSAFPQAYLEMTTEIANEHGNRARELADAARVDARDDPNAGDDSAGSDD